MKKIKLFSFISFLFLVISCSDENVIEPENSINPVESSINCPNGNPTQDFIIFPNQFFPNSIVDLQLPLGITWDRCVDVLNRDVVRVVVSRTDSNGNNLNFGIFDERLSNTGRVEFPSSIFNVGDVYSVLVQVEVAPFTFVTDESILLRVVDTGEKIELDTDLSLVDIGGSPRFTWNKDAIFAEEIEMELIFNGVNNGVFITANDGSTSPNSYRGLSAGDDSDVIANLCAAGNYSDRIVTDIFID